MLRKILGAIATSLLVPFYVLGVLAAWVVALAVVVAAAVRLGWTDVRNRANGPA